jgi:hypothetical protein
MTARLVAIGLAVGLVLALDLRASAEPDRVAAISHALVAVHDLGAARRDQLERDIYRLARTRCHADAAPPAPPCLAEIATGLCGGDAKCEAAADVVAANTRAASDWIDETTRARLVRSASDYRAALFSELHRRFAALAAELALAGGHDPAAIDRLCRERDRAVHACTGDDPTCVPSLPWSRCVAALVWFVGSTP